MSDQDSRAREILDNFASIRGEELELTEADHQAMKAVVRYINNWCSPPFDVGNLIFDDDAYFFFTMGRAYERLAPGSPGTVQVAA